MSVQSGKVENNEKTISNWPPDGSARSDRGMAVGKVAYLAHSDTGCSTGGQVLVSTAAPSYVHAR